MNDISETRWCEHGVRLDDDCLFCDLHERDEEIKHLNDKIADYADLTLRLQEQCDRYMSNALDAWDRVARLEGAMNTVIGWCQENINSKTQVTPFCVQVRDTIEQSITLWSDCPACSSPDHDCNVHTRHRGGQESDGD